MMRKGECFTCDAASHERWRTERARWDAVNRCGILVDALTCVLNDHITRGLECKCNACGTCQAAAMLGRALREDWAQRACGTVEPR